MILVQVFAFCCTLLQKLEAFPSVLKARQTFLHDLRQRTSLASSLFSKTTGVPLKMKGRGLSRSSLARIAVRDSLQQAQWEKDSASCFFVQVSEICDVKHLFLPLAFFFLLFFRGWACPPHPKTRIATNTDKKKKKKNCAHAEMFQQIHSCDPQIYLPSLVLYS